MSEVPIKQFWATPTVALDLSPLTNRIAVLQAEVATLTRERDEASKERDDIIMICRGTQIDDAALSSMRMYVEEKLRIERERDAARKVTDAARALYRASAVDRVSVDDVQEKLAALFAALTADSGCLGAPFCSKGCCAPKDGTADATSSFADSLIGIHEATQCDGCGMFRCRCARTADAEATP